MYIVMPDIFPSLSLRPPSRSPILKEAESIRTPLILDSGIKCRNDSAKKLSSGMTTEIKGHLMKPIEQLTKEEALAELKYIAEEMAKSDIAYYQNDAPYLTDAEYDSLKLRNEQIEKRFPELRHHHKCFSTYDTHS